MEKQALLNTYVNNVGYVRDNLCDRRDDCV